MESVENMEVKRYMQTIFINDNDDVNEDVIEKNGKEVSKLPKYSENYGKCKTSISSVMCQRKKCLGRLFVLVQARNVWRMI